MPNEPVLCDDRDLRKEPSAPTQDDRMTVASFVEKVFLPEHIARKSRSGRTHYQAILKHVLRPQEVDFLFRVDAGKSKARLEAVANWPYLSDLRLQDTRPDHVQRLVSAALTRGYSTQTVVHIRNVVNCIFAQAKKMQYLSGANPASLVTVPEIKRKEAHSLTLAQLKDVLGVMQYPEKEMVLFAIVTGMNMTEICGLQWKHINLTEAWSRVDDDPIPPRTIAVRKPLGDDQSGTVYGKSRERNLPISEMLFHVLSGLLHRMKRAGSDDFVFSSEAGAPIHARVLAARRLKLIGKELDMPWLSWRVFHRTHRTLPVELLRSQDLVAVDTSMPNSGVCVIVENCPLPADRRVWQEAVALKAAGYDVSIICPKGPGFERALVTQEGIEICPHATYEGSSVLGYLFEYVAALVAEFRLAWKVYRRRPFHVLHACNPPDNIFLIALFFKLVFGVKFIFDHHDPSPELYEARFQRRDGLYWFLRLLERWTFRVADAAIATNETIREIALKRGKVQPEQAFVVRTCPDMDRFKLPSPNPSLREGRNHLVLYLGHMGPQDGLDLLLDSIDHLVNKQGRRDTTFVFIGRGPEADRLKVRSAALGLRPYATFTGALYGDALLQYLASADVGVSPDPYNAFNDQLTMLKIMEYMACGLPVVLYDLSEGRRTAADAALYAKRNDPIDFANKIAELLDSDELRIRLGKTGRQRIQEQMTWDKEKPKLLAAYRAVLNAGTAR